MLESWRRERFFRVILRRVTRQRALMNLDSENIWVIEDALPNDEQTQAALRTCHMRGWVEPLEDARLSTEWIEDVELVDVMEPVGEHAIYRLTSAGWDALRGTHRLLLWTLVASLGSFAITLIGLLIARAFK